MVTPFDENFNIEADVVVYDFKLGLVSEEASKFKAALEALKVKMEAAEKELKEKEEEDKKRKEEEANKPVPAPAIKVEEAKLKVEEVEPDFEKHFAIFNKPDLTDKEEMSALTGLIKEKKSALVKQLVIRMALDNKGKSPIFKTLSKKFSEEILKKINDESKLKVEEVKEENKGTGIKETDKVKPEELVKKEGEAKVEEEKARKS